MKIIYCPLGDQSPMERAFRDVGVELIVYNFWGRFLETNDAKLVRHEFLQLVNQHRDAALVFIQAQLTGIFDLHTIYKAKSLAETAVFVNWSGDCRTGAESALIGLSDAFDMTLISSTGQLELYKNAGCKRIDYLQIGYDETTFYPKNLKDFDYDITLAANCYPLNSFEGAKTRIEACRILKNRFPGRFALYGSGYGEEFPGVSGVPMPELPGIYARSMCLLSISNFNNIANYFSDRLLLCLATGRPVISWNFPKLEEYFTPNSEILVANTYEEICDKVQWVKNNLEEANQIGRNGAAKVLAEFSNHSRVVEILAKCNILKKLS